MIPPKQAAYVLAILGLVIMLVIQFSALTSPQTDNSQPDTATVTNWAGDSPDGDIFYKMAPPAAPLISARAGSIPNKPKH